MLEMGITINRRLCELEERVAVLEKQVVKRKRVPKEVANQVQLTLNLKQRRVLCVAK